MPLLHGMSNAAHSGRKWLEQDETGAKRGRSSNRAEVAKQTDDDSSACTERGKEFRMPIPDD